MAHKPTCAAAQVSNNVIATEPDEALGPAVADEFAITTNGHFAVQRRESSVDMRIDGRLDETAWRDLQAHDDFRVIDPDTLEPASLPTEVVLFYTDKGLYVGARMTQDPNTLVEYLSGRDQGFLNRDYFSFTLDTSGEGRYGFWFQLNLGDTKSDGTILPERQYSSSWDGAWRGATARSDEGWSAEFFVSWSLVNMPKANGTRTMGIFAQRKVAHSDERHAWATSAVDEAEVHGPSSSNSPCRRSAPGSSTASSPTPPPATTVSVAARPAGAGSTCSGDRPATSS